MTAFYDSIGAILSNSISRYSRLDSHIGIASLEVIIEFTFLTNRLGFFLVISIRIDDKPIFGSVNGFKA